MQIIAVFKLVILTNLLVDAATVHLHVIVTVPFDKPYLFRKQLVEPAIDAALELWKKFSLFGIEHYDFHVAYQ